MADQLETFLQGLAAATNLLNRAVEKRSALECIVLQANLLDGLLRVALILKAQLDNGNDAIDESLLKQTDEDRATTERAIYRRCRAAGFLDDDLFAQLMSAYDKRNKCIHRYVLSDIDYEYATRLVFELDALLDRVRTVVWELEDTQIKRGVGMTRSGQTPGRNYLTNFAAGKEKLEYMEGDRSWRRDDG